MKLERTKVDFPLWRKKVDKSLFEQGTTIPNWACDLWNISAGFRGVNSRKMEEAAVTIRFGKKIYKGHVTEAAKGRANPAYRLWYEEDLINKLRDEFLMSYMRALEEGLSNNLDDDIEDLIPFWEFLDIEYDSDNREFRFTAHYKQKPSFPNLFKRLVGSPSLQKIYDEIEGKDDKRIYKQDWKERSELPLEIGAMNVIYTLIDINNKLLYIGEAKNLVKRLSQHYSSIPHWNYFRYDVLPDSLAPFRVALERMIIRSFATVLPNKKGVESFDISGFKMANDKIDK